MPDPTNSPGADKTATERKQGRRTIFDNCQTLGPFRTTVANRYVAVSPCNELTPFILEK